MEKKRNLNEEMKKALPHDGTRPRLLLHVCCAPCSSSVLQRLTQCDVTPFFYNPNLDTAKEYALRAKQLYVLAAETALDARKIVVADYNPTAFLDAIRLVECAETLPEGGARCQACIAHRLTVTAHYAKENGFDLFCSTLSVSPHKDAAYIQSVGERLQQTTGVRYLPNDFKKENGYLRSTQLSRSLGLYRQDYCGCAFSRMTEGGRHD